MNLVKDNFGNWSGTERKTIAVSEVSLPTQAKTEEIYVADKANVDIFIGHPTSLGRKNADFYAAYIANQALGGDTLIDRLGIVIREQHGLTYGVYSVFEETGFGAAPWWITVSVNPANIDKTLTLVSQVVSDYRKTGITDDELKRKIGDVVGSFNVSLRSSSGIASELTRFEFLGLGVAEMDELPGKFRALTKADVDSAARKYFDPERAVTVIAGTFERE